MSAAAPPLAGRGILITRPHEQAEGLAAHIAAAGGRPVLFPALEIAPPSDSATLQRTFGRLREFDLIVFVSPTAVERAWPHLAASYADWPRAYPLAAVGQGSLRALGSRGGTAILAPASGADSESLLAMQELADMRGRRVLIVRGEGGRALLGDTLASRGAAVEYAECYRRLIPRVDPAPLLDAWQRGGIAAVTVTSGEILANLRTLLGAAGAELLRVTPLFALHERIAAAARQQGIITVIATPPGDAGLVAGLVDWFTRAHG